MRSEQGGKGGGTNEADASTAAASGRGEACLDSQGAHMRLQHGTQREQEMLQSLGRHRGQEVGLVLVGVHPS